MGSLFGRRYLITGQPGLSGLLGALVLALVHSASAMAQRSSADEGAVKAAFVYNFAKFTDWPEEVWNRSTTMRVCAAGARNAFSHALTALDPQLSIHGKEIEVQTISRPQEVARCHLLVITGSESVGEWLRHARTLPMLTIGDAEGFAVSGGIIGLFVEGEKVKFEINQEAALRAGIKLSSRLVKLARLVKEDPRGNR
ncbi:MAG TPA: YfiR family protein [Accumulibacter sp.]|nr:YfiR family protein [Accumulibacter sp.]HMX22939.1 YfiR family protein [Accumulibacter sp.]